MPYGLRKVPNLVYIQSFKYNKIYYIMNLNDYQKRAVSTAIYPRDYAIVYPALGLAGEAGEVAEKVKKMIRDDNGILSPERKEAIILELGDVIWYIGSLANDLGVTLEEIAQRNLDKLAKRKEVGKLKGDGDEREVE